MDQLLSSFEVIRSQQYQRGKPYQQTRLMVFEGTPPSTGFSAKLKKCRNWNGHWYAEDHVEEWVSRCPQALFPGRRVHVLASQNYAHLPEKIDLLFLDNRHQFHVVEVKAEPVASNGGITPDEISGQMNRYVDFLRMELLPFPASFTNYYTHFTRKFLGSPQDLSTDLRQTFGEPFFLIPSTSPVLRQTFLTEGYDADAVDYFKARQRLGSGPIRLIYYKFYLEAGTDRHRIEFWEVPISRSYAEVMR
jgi:hypothetical protein